MKLQTSENITQITEVIGYNEKMYNTIKRLSDLKTPVYITTKKSKEILVFNEQYNVYAAEPFYVNYKFQEMRNWKKWLEDRVVLDREN